MIEILAAFEIEGAAIYEKIKPAKKGVKMPRVDKVYKYGAIARGVFENPKLITLEASKNGKTYKTATTLIFEGRPYGMNNIGDLVKIIDERRRATDEDNG